MAELKVDTESGEVRGLKATSARKIGVDEANKLLYPSTIPDSKA